MITNARITYGIKLHLTKVITSNVDMWYHQYLPAINPRLLGAVVQSVYSISKALVIQECTSSTTSRGYNIVSQWNVGN